MSVPVVSCLLIMFHHKSPVVSKPARMQIPTSQFSTELILPKLTKWFVHMPALTGVLGSLTVFYGRTNTIHWHLYLTLLAQSLQVKIWKEVWVKLMAYIHQLVTQVPKRCRYLDNQTSWHRSTMRGWWQVWLECLCLLPYTCCTHGTCRSVCHTSLYVIQDLSVWAV